MGWLDPLFRAAMGKYPPMERSDEDRSMVFGEEIHKTLAGTPPTHTEYIFTSWLEDNDQAAVPLGWEILRRLCADRQGAVEIRLRQQEKTGGDLACCFPAKCFRLMQAVRPARSVYRQDDSRVFLLTQGFDPEPYAWWKEFGCGDCWILYHIFPDDLPLQDAEEAARSIDAGRYDLRLDMDELGHKALYVVCNNETVELASVGAVMEQVCREHGVPFRSSV